jgi:ABC-type Co2+ transport system permease subunit
MQGAYLSITIGLQFYLLVGYLLYFVVRKWSYFEYRISLMSWTAGFIGLLTIGLLLSVILVSPRMASGEVMLVGVIMVADIVALLLLIADTFNRAVSVELYDNMEL